MEKTLDNSYNPPFPLAWHPWPVWEGFGGSGACRSTFTAYYEARRDSIHVSNLGNQPRLAIEALEVALLLVDSHRRVPKGNAMNAKLGDDELPLDSIEGAVAFKVFGKSPGDSVFRRITPIAALLVHLGLAHDDCKSGYLTASRAGPHQG